MELVSKTAWFVIHNGHVLLSTQAMHRQDCMEAFLSSEYGEGKTWEDCQREYKNLFCDKLEVNFKTT